MFKKLLQLSLALFATGSLFAQSSIPNGGFEKWTTTTWLDPMYYQTSNPSNVQKGIPVNVVRSASSFHGSYAVQASTILSGTDTVVGYFIDGNPSGPSVQGGIPYSQKPTGISFHYKYTRTAIDTGLVLAIFKKAGSVIGGAQIKLDTAKYYKLYTMSFALLLTPDTIVFGGVSSLGAINGKRGIPGSVLTIDSVTYTGGVSQPAELNGDFENWQSDSLALPQGWQFANSGTISNYQTTDKYTGKYALEIQTTSQNSNGKDSAVTAEATTGQETGFGVAGGVPFTNKIDTLELYYKYAAANVNDSAQVTVELKKSGTMIYMRDTLIGASASYKRIRLPFNSPSVPDSVIVRLNSSKKWRQALSYVGATLKTDNIRFTSQAVAPVAGFKGGNVVCVGSTINYTDTTQNSPTTWSWTFGGGGTPNISGSQNPSIVYNSAGTYTTKLVVTNSAGSDSAMQTITVVTTPTVVVTGNTSICPGGNTVLTGTGASTYVWSTTSTNDTIHVAPAATATYSVTGTAIGGCSGTATVTVTVNPTPTITATATPTLVCQGNPTTLTASGATTYSWSTGATTSSANASPAAATTYTVTGTSSFGCMGTQTVSVAVNASPTLMVSGKTPICSGTHDTLRVIDTAGDAGFLKYKWNTGATTNQVSGKLTSTSTFTVVITDGNGCKDSAIQKITVHTNPTVTMSGNVFGGFTICSGNIDSLHAKATGGSGVYNYKWTTTGTNDTALVKTAGTYSVLVTDGNGCTYAGSTSVVVKVNATPTLTAYATTPSFCDGGSTPLNCTGATTYTWLPATNLSASTGSPVTATPTVSVTYTVTGTTTGCSSSKKVPVTVTPGPPVTLSYSAPGDTICQGGSVTITANGANTYSWSTGSTATSINVSPTVTTTYTVTGTKTGCSTTKLDTITVNICTGVSVLNQSQAVTVYPNPSNGMFTLQITNYEGGNVNMDIYNILGEKIYTKNNMPFTTHNSQFAINMSDKPSGIYLYRLYTADGQVINKGRLIITK